jgi:hypothetical protein
MGQECVHIPRPGMPECSAHRHRAIAILTVNRRETTTQQVCVSSSQRFAEAATAQQCIATNLNHWQIRHKLASHEDQSMAPHNAVWSRLTNTRIMIAPAPV